MWNQIIPQLRTIQPNSGAFTLSEPLRVHLPDSEDSRWVQRINDAATRVVQLPFPMLSVVPSEGGGDQEPNVSILEPNRSEHTMPENGYELIVSPSGITIRCRSVAGRAHALATLTYGLLLSGERPLPAVHITDAPESPWRGFMIDVARHFFPMESLQQILDYLWLLRLNRFHVHLTDDQGWRLPVPEYPRLTDVGGTRPAGTSDNQWIGGSYTREELQELDRDAQAMGVVVVPEVDLPGHASAALAAYPNLSCSGAEHGVETRWGIFPAVVCAQSSEVRTFLTRVYHTLTEIFSGEYIHIGGDEVPTEPWEECPRCSTLEDPYQTIVRVMAESVIAAGRRPVAWDEASALELPPETIIVNWRGPEGAMNALHRGYDLILAPEGRAAYLDHKHRDSPLEPGRLGVCTITDSMSFAPAPYVAAHRRDTPVAGTIIGGQANLWTEGIRFHREIEYMAFLRLAAVAQGLWSGSPGTAAQGFPESLVALRERLHAHGYAVYPGSFE
ncbi:MAG: beta-N-acetylhexosaminidase [Alkalispirochaeta sp.]